MTLRRGLLFVVFHDVLNYKNAKIKSLDINLDSISLALQVIIKTYL